MEKDKQFIEQVVATVRDYADEPDAVHVGVDLNLIPGALFDALAGTVVRDKPYPIKVLFSHRGCYVHAYRAPDVVPGAVPIAKAA